MNEIPAPMSVPGLRRLRFWTRAALLGEILLPRLLPALLPPGLYAAAALLGVLGELPAWTVAALFALTAASTLALLAHALRRLALPSRSQTDRRLEEQSGLKHQPLRTLADAATAGSAELWALHLAAARAQLGRLRLAWPRPAAAAADPRALRALVTMLLAAGIGISGQDAPGRLAAAFWPSLSFLPHATPPSINAWITPPGYTGLPPLVLKPEGGLASVPEGSVFAATLAAADGTPRLAIGKVERDFTPLDARDFQATANLTASGRVAIVSDGSEIAAWGIGVEADQPPQVSFPRPPSGVAQADGAETRLPWQARHRYGVADLHAELRLADRPDAPPLEVPIPLQGAPKEGHGIERADLAANPWAGLPVIATLIARDVAGHSAQSEAARFVLPERRFRNKMARAVIGVRRQLSLRPFDTAQSADALDALGETQDFWNDDPSGYLNLSAIAALLRHAPGEVDQAQSRMWQLALHLEEGAPDRTERALEAAQREMHQALDPGNDGRSQENSDDPHKAEQLAQALRQRLDALSQAARRDPDSPVYNPDAHPEDRRDMERLSDALREATKEGKRDIARGLMAELDRKLDALKGSRAERKPEDAARDQKRRQGKRQMNVVQEMVQREGQLLDHSQFRPFDDDAKPQDAPPQQDDSRVQLALRRALGILMQQYGDLTGSVPDNLGRADMAMRDAAKALELGHDMEAAGNEQTAIEALQQGGRDMSRQMARQFSQGQNGDDQSGAQSDDDDGDDSQMANGDDGSDDDPMQGMGDGGQGDHDGNGGQRSRRADRQGRDPLGRPHGNGTGGLDDDGETSVPEQMEAARTRQLQEELRRRSADRTRQQEELQYIDRLLKQF
jgi:uncharacterized protein (TIGR02302 family)